MHLKLSSPHYQQHIYQSIRKAHWSAKKGQHSFTLIILCGLDGKLYWISESYPGGVTDQMLVRLPEIARVLKCVFKDGIFVLGDAAFKGLYKEGVLVYTPIEPNIAPLTAWEEEKNEEFRSMRIIVENVIRQFKRFRICSDKFQSKDKDLHHLVWTAIGVIVNLYAREIR